MSVERLLKRPCYVGQGSVARRSSGAWALSRASLMAATDVEVEKVIHRGGCHCGAVRFQVRAPRELVAWDCNCSICMMKRNTHFFVPQQDLTCVSLPQSRCHHLLHVSYRSFVLLPLRPHVCNSVTFCWHSTGCGRVAGRRCRSIASEPSGRATSSAPPAASAPSTCPGALRFRLMLLLLLSSSRACESLSVWWGKSGSPDVTVC